MTTVIYGLCDPRTGVLRYVGKTVQPLPRRLRAHLSQKTEDHRGRWIAVLRAEGLVPDIFCIEEVPEDACWREAERHAIAYYRSVGCVLTNNASGGDGPESYTSTMRAKMAQSARDRDPASRVFTAAARANMASAKLKQSRDTRDKLAQAGRNLSAETRLKRRAAASAVSSETKQKMSQSAKNKAVLTPKIVREIRALTTAGDMSLAAIGRRFGLSATAVSRIKSRATWASVAP